MEKKLIISILLVFVASTAMFSQSLSTLFPWERKSAPAVILGRYVDREHSGTDKHPDVWGNNGSLKGGRAVASLKSPLILSLAHSPSFGTSAIR